MLSDDIKNLYTTLHTCIHIRIVFINFSHISQLKNSVWTIVPQKFYWVLVEYHRHSQFCSGKIFVFNPSAYTVTRNYERTEWNREPHSNLNWVLPSYSLQTTGSRLLWATRVHHFDDPKNKLPDSCCPYIITNTAAMHTQLNCQLFFNQWQVSWDV